MLFRSVPRNGESSLLKRNHKDTKAVRLPMESGNVSAVYPLMYLVCAIEVCVVSLNDSQISEICEGK